MDSQFAQELMIVWQSLQESALAGSRHLSDVFHHLHERDVLHCVSTDTFGEGDDARLGRRAAAAAAAQDRAEPHRLGGE